MASTEKQLQTLEIHVYAGRTSLGAMTMLEEDHIRSVAAVMTTDLSLLCAEGWSCMGVDEGKWRVCVL